MIRKLEYYYKRYDKTTKNSGSKETHLVIIKRTTIWFLFIPIYWKEEIVRTNLF